MQLTQFSKTGHPPTLLASFLYFDISFMVWVLMGVLGLYIAGDFHLTPGQKGLVAAIPILGGALVRIPLGILVDQIGPKKTGVLSQLLVVIPLAGIWLFSSDFQAILVFGFLLGIAGGSFAVALPLASRCYPPQHQGTALGIVGAGNSGTVLASLLAPRLAEWVGWRNVFGLALIPVSLVLILFIFLAKETNSGGKTAPKNLTHYFTLLKNSDPLWFCLFYSFTFGGFVGLASFLGIFFHDQYGLSNVQAGYLTAFSVFAGSFCRPLGGYLADRFGGISVLSYSFSLIAILMLAIGFLPPLSVTVLLLFFATASFGMGNGAVFQLVPLRFGRDIGVMTGIIGAAGGIGGFFLPLLLGFSKQLIGSYGIGFIFFACVGLWLLTVLNVLGREWKLSWLTEND